MYIPIDSFPKKVELFEFVRRGWYESTDFWSPALYDEFLFEPLRRDVQLVHQADKTMDYVMASGSMPLLDAIKRSGVDLYSNIDPLAPQTDVGRIRQQIGDQVALCGGVNNFIVLERGTEDQVRTAVGEAVELFTPPAGCILAPSDSLFLGEPGKMERNLHTMVDTWKDLCWN